MINKVLAIACFGMGAIVSVLGGIGVYSWTTGEPVAFTTDAEVQGDWVAIHRMGVSVPSIPNLVFTFGLAAILFGGGFLLLRNSASRGLS